MRIAFALFTVISLNGIVTRKTPTQVPFKTHDHNGELKHSYSYLQALLRFSQVCSLVCLPRSPLSDPAISDSAHFNQSNCLEKSIGELPSISTVERGVALHKIEFQFDA